MIADYTFIYLSYEYVNNKLFTVCLKISHFPYNQSDMSVFVLSCESIFFLHFLKIIVHSMIYIIHKFISIIMTGI